MAFRSTSMHLPTSVSLIMVSESLIWLHTRCRMPVWSPVHPILSVNARLISAREQAVQFASTAHVHQARWPATC